MVNIPRALFSGRTGRQPLYHIAIEELQEWAYTGEPLVPLKGFPGVVWQRSKKKKRAITKGCSELALPDPCDVQDTIVGEFVGAGQP